MASCMWSSIYGKQLQFNSKSLCNLYVFVRNGHHLRGKPPGVAKSLAQKLEEQSYKDPSVYYRVDIGLPPLPKSKSKLLQERLKVLKENHGNSELEKLARNKKLLIDLRKVKEDNRSAAGPLHIKTIADHYGVFLHLFGDAYFMPRVPLNIVYPIGDLNIPVYYGNVVKPVETCQKPEVAFESDDDSLWTLILTNPDGHFSKENAEYIHWFVGNIPGNKIEKGEIVVDYMRAFPTRGTGYHRHIFVLYKQEKKLDFSELKRTALSIDLEERTFSTLDFYKTRQDVLTPAGLSFFQSDWDPSVTDFFHNSLKIKEPIFEYDFPPHYTRPQEWFALRQPFNLYMDRYRDPKQINKEFLERKLKRVHPFKTPPKPYPYPNAVTFDEYNPSWLKLEKTKSRLRWGRINDIE